MKGSLIGLVLGLAIGSGGTYFLNDTRHETNTAFDLNLLAGEYSAIGDYQTSTLAVTEVISSNLKQQREFKAQFHWGSISGCVGEFMGYGKPEKESIVFETLDKHPCRFIVKPQEGMKFLEVSIDGDNCSDFSGAACAIADKLEREGKFNYFVELETLAAEHPMEVLKLTSASKALTEIMGTEYNYLYERMIASKDAKGTFNNNLYCAEGAKPGVASKNKAIFCLDYKNGHAQAAVMIDGQIKNYTKGKIWDPIVKFSPDWWRK